MPYIAFAVAKSPVTPILMMISVQRYPSAKIKRADREREGAPTVRYLLCGRCVETLLTKVLFLKKKRSAMCVYLLFFFLINLNLNI